MSQLYCLVKFNQSNLVIFQCIISWFYKCEIKIRLTRMISSGFGSFLFGYQLKILFHGDCRHFILSKAIYFRLSSGFGHVYFYWVCIWASSPIPNPTSNPLAHFATQNHKAHVPSLLTDSNYTFDPTPSPTSLNIQPKALAPFHLAQLLLN